MKFFKRFSNVAKRWLPQGLYSRLSSASVQDLVAGALAVLVLLGLWELLVWIGFLSLFQFPPPSRVASAFGILVSVGLPQGVLVWQHIGATLTRIGEGYVLATVVGIPLGMLLGRISLLGEAFGSLITLGRSVAAISLLPLFVGWFGPGELSKYLLIAYAAFWVILTNTIDAVRLVDNDLIRAGRILGANRRQLFFRVILPASTPRIFAGMKIALGISFAVIVAAELLGTVEGLGALLMQARRVYQTDVAMAGMFLLAILGFLLSWGLDRVERVLLPWSAGLEEDNEA